MSGQTFTSDLRSDAKEFSRDKDNRVKWQHGPSYGPGRRVEDAKPRPARVLPHVKSCYPGPMKARTSLNKDIASASDESSADEEMEHPSTAPDAEIAYSFDAERGPSHGSQILKHALDVALERHHGQETDKLIKNEYEVLDREAEALSPHAHKGRVVSEDEDYYFVEA